MPDEYDGDVTNTIRRERNKMPTATLTRNATTEAAIFARLWEGGTRVLTVTVARHILILGFSMEDQSRMRLLSEKNRAGGLTEEEAEELDNFIRVGDLLAILQSKARQRLKRAGLGKTRNG